MATYGEMLARIADEMLRTDLDSQLELAVQTAIDEYRHRRFWFNEGATTFTTSIGGITYDIPATVLETDILTTIYSTTEYALQPRDFDWIRAANSNVNNVAGPPIAFALFAEQFWLYPTPDQAYPLISYGLRDLGTLTATSDTNAWTTEAEALIRNRAKKEIAEAILAAPDLAAIYETAELRALKALRSRTTSRRASKTLRPMGF